MNLAHLRVKNINMSYDIPRSLINRLGIRSLSMNFSIENAGMIYYKSWDKNLDPIQVINQGQIYPPSRTFALGFKIGI